MNASGTDRAARLSAELRDPALWAARTPLPLALVDYHRDLLRMFDTPPRLDFNNQRDHEAILLAYLAEGKPR